jgi:hypothetical protein
MFIYHAWRWSRIILVIHAIILSLSDIDDREIIIYVYLTAVGASGKPFLLFGFYAFFY